MYRVLATIHLTIGHRSITESNYNTEGSLFSVLPTLPNAKIKICQSWKHCVFLVVLLNQMESKYTQYNYANSWKYV